MIFQILTFVVSCLILALLSKSLVKTLVQVARYLNLREFIVGFFLMSFATSLPNLFVDINAAMQGFPQLAFGDVVGGNFIDLTLVMAIAVLFSRKSLSTKSDMVQKSAVFTVIIAILPLLLILDRNLSRVDGAILILSFAVYCFWMFSRQSNFQKVYNSQAKPKNMLNPFWLAKNIGKLVLLIGLLLVSSFIVIDTAQYFAKSFGSSLALVGILIVALGNCFPETYFSIISARKNEGWMVLGDLMGSVIVCATLVLGIVALVNPFIIEDFSPFLIARFFTILAVIFYLFFIKSDKKITKKEALMLLFLYIVFLLAEVFIKF